MSDTYLLTPTAIGSIANLLFHPGQKVIERYGDTAESAKTCETEIVSVEGTTCMVDTGGVYDALTGAAEPRGTTYRSIRSLTPDDDRRAKNLLGGTESKENQPRPT